MLDDPNHRDGTLDPAREHETLPAELESLHRRLVADGAAWRLGLPSAQGVIQRARHATGQDLTAVPMLQHEWADRSSQHSALHVNPIQKRGQQSMKISHLRGAATATAALAVVAMLALLFHAFAAGRGPAGSTQPGAQLGAGTSTADVHGRWQTISGLTFTTAQQGPSGIPAIAPSDPNTAYEAALAPAKLRRTTDAGATWTNLKIPGDTANIEAFQVFVSPLDAKSVFLTLTTPLPPTAQASCPTLAGTQASMASAPTGDVPLAMTLPRSGTIPCSLQYHSSDGGDTWKQLTLPVHAVLADIASDFLAPTTHILRTQGTRLYAAAGCGPLCQGPGDDIVSSTDGGATWALVDHGIRAAGQTVCDFMPALTGSDVFALASSQGCSDESLPPLVLWHSADAGAHWTRVGQPPSNLSFGMAVVAQPSGAPLLYIHMPQATPVPHTVQMTNDATSLRVSADGGKTWKAAPSGGVPGGAEPLGPQAVLGDGTVVEALGGSTGTPLYGWKLGDTAWHLVAPAMQGQLSQLLVVSQGSGADRLIAVTAGGQSGQNTTTYTVQSYVA